MLSKYILILVAVAYTTAQQTPNLKDTLKNSFKRIDADGNGVATMNEFQALIKSFDADKDGKVTITEYAAAVGQDVKAIKPLFDNIDVNHNMNIDDVDIKFAIKMFDVDGNGEVTEMEFIVQYSAFITKILG